MDVFVCDSETRFVCFHPDTPGVYASDTDRNVRLEAANMPGRGGGVNVGVDVMFCRTLGACQDAMDGRKSLLSAAR